MFTLVCALLGERVLKEWLRSTGNYMYRTNVDVNTEKISDTKIEIFAAHLYT